MRIWSKCLIPYLPKKQLIAMRYELGDMIKQYPNIKNGLVKFANNYDIAYLGVYFVNVCEELWYRQVKQNQKYNDTILNTIRSSTKIGFSFYDYYSFKEDDDQYLKICLMNLYEKYLREMISEAEWETISDRFRGIIYGN